MTSNDNASQRLPGIAEDQAMSYPYPMASSTHAPLSLSTTSTHSTTSSRSTASHSLSVSSSSSASHWTSSMETSPSSPPCCYPILPSDSIFPIWDTVLDEILRTFDLRAWNSVGVYRIGWETDMSPTVLVTVNTGRDWHLEREGIKRILHQSNLPMVGVKVFEARNFSALSTSTVAASLGQSLAPPWFPTGGWNPWGRLRTPEHSGTNRQKRLENGQGYLSAIELKETGMLYGQAKGLYNSVSTSIESLKAERRGLLITTLGPKRPLCLAPRAQTSLGTLYSSALLGAHLTLEYKKANSHIAGAVRYASGACRSIPSRTHSNGDLVVMDWALVEMKNYHVCSNKIPRQDKAVNSTLHSKDPSLTLQQEVKVIKKPPPLRLDTLRTILADGVKCTCLASETETILI